MSAFFDRAKSRLGRVLAKLRNRAVAWALVSVLFGLLVAWILESLLASAGATGGAWIGSLQTVAAFALIAVTAAYVYLTRELVRSQRESSAEQLRRLDEQRKALDTPALDWSTREDAPFFAHPRDDMDTVTVLVPCEATNVGGVAQIGPLQLEEGTAFVHDQSLKARILRGQQHTVTLSFGPFKRGAPFEAWTIFSQKYRGLGDAQWVQDYVLAWVDHDWRTNDAALHVLQVFPEMPDYADYRKALLLRFKAMAIARRDGLYG